MDRRIIAIKFLWAVSATISNRGDYTPLGPRCATHPGAEQDADYPTIRIAGLNDGIAVRIHPVVDAVIERRQDFAGLEAVTSRRRDREPNEVEPQQQGSRVRCATQHISHRALADAVWDQGQQYVDSGETPRKPAFGDHGRLRVQDH